MSLKYKIDINWKDIERGRPYRPIMPAPSIANELADVFITASTTLAEEVTQDFADDNTRMQLVLTIKPPAPKLEYYSSFAVKSNQPFDDDKKFTLHKEILQAIANAQEKIALQLGLNISLSNSKSGEVSIHFRNISPIKRARFDVELNKQLPDVLKEVCNTLGYGLEFNANKLTPHQFTPFEFPPRTRPF